MIFIPTEGWTPPELSYYQPEWASMAGYDTAFWQEPGESYYRQTPPEAGVEAPINYGGAVHGKPVWLHFETAWGYDNGEWRSAEELEQVAAVLGIVRHAPSSSQSPHLVTPHRIYTLLDLLAADPYPAVQGFWDDPFGRVFVGCLGSNRLWMQTLGPYRFWNFNLESEVGMWLIARDEHGVMSAVMCGQWTHGARFFYAGHRRLTDAEAARLR